MLTVKDRQGRTLEIQDPVIEGELISFTRVLDGQSFTVPLDALDARSVKRLKKIAAEASKATQVPEVADTSDASAEDLALKKEKIRAARSAKAAAMHLDAFNLRQENGPVGEIITLRSLSHSMYAFTADDGGVSASSGSSLSRNTHFVVESAGKGRVLLKSIFNEKYLQNDEWLRATATEPSVSAQWEWYQDGEKVFLKNVGNRKFLEIVRSGGRMRASGGDIALHRAFEVAPPSDGLDQALSWSLIPSDPRYPEKEVILALCQVTDPRFNLPSDTVNNDCTEAFQAAIDFAAEAGGGTVFVPEGQYRVDGPIKIWSNVLLRGRWAAPTEPDYKGRLGSLILLENDQIDIDKAVFEHHGGGIQGFTFWHSKQNPKRGVTKYPWVFQGKGGAFVHNITMLNAYRGIYFQRTSNADIKNIYGSAYDIGLSLGPNYAISRNRNQQFSSKFLEMSGLQPDPMHIRAHMDEVYASGLAIQAERLHGTRAIYGHHTGFRVFKEFMTKAFMGGLNGALIENCQIGLFYDAAGARNTAINGTQMKGNRIAVKSSDGRTFTLNNSIISGSLEADIIAEDKPLEVIFNNSVADPRKMELFGGSVTGEPSKMAVDTFVMSAAVEEAPQDDFIAEVEQGEGEASEGEDAEAIEVEVSLDIEDAIVRRPLKVDMFNVRDPKFAGGAKANGLADDTEAIRAAVAAANANGGGYVFFPGGEYRITGSIYVEEGVELRGASGGRERLIKPGNGSTLYIDSPPIPAGANEIVAEATITLGDYSGVRGLGFYYPSQTAGGTETPFKKYPYTIRGNGLSNYVMYVSPVNPYRFINFNGDDNLVAYSFFSGIRQMLFVNGTNNGLAEQIMTKPTNWPKSEFSFPSNMNHDQYKTNVMNHGFELLHLKDSDNYQVSKGGYHHGGFRGATIENSSGDLGRFSLEQYVTGVAILSGDKEIVVSDKTATSNRHGPEGPATNQFALKIFPEFTGRVLSHNGTLAGHFQEMLSVQSGTYYRTGGGNRFGDNIGGLFVGENGSAYLENVRFKGSFGIKNEGAFKMLNCTFGGIYYKYAEEVGADNTFQTIFAGVDVSHAPVVSYGLFLDGNGIEQSGVQMSRNTGISQLKYRSKTTNGEFNLKLEDPEFLNKSPNSVSFTAVGTFFAGSTLEFWYQSKTGWKAIKARHVGETTSKPWNIRLKDVKFGQESLGSEHPDMRIVVKDGESPAITAFKINTAVYEQFAPKAPTLLTATGGDGVSLKWQHESMGNVTFNVYRRESSSGTFGEPIARGLKAPQFLDRSPYRAASYMVTAVSRDGRESLMSADIRVSDTMAAEIVSADDQYDLEIAKERHDVRRPFDSDLFGVRENGIRLNSDGSRIVERSGEFGIQLIDGAWFEVDVTSAVFPAEAASPLELVISLDVVAPTSLGIMYDSFEGPKRMVLNERGDQLIEIAEAGRYEYTFLVPDARFAQDSFRDGDMQIGFGGDIFKSLPRILDVRLLPVGSNGSETIASWGVETLELPMAPEVEPVMIAEKVSEEVAPVDSRSFWTSNAGIMVIGGGAVVFMVIIGAVLSRKPARKRRSHGKRARA
ncbi:MAG: glycosyl hydrolase family 28-related protein [Opitutales bacterium]